MAKTQYASGRTKLPAPTVAALSGGSTTSAASGTYRVFIQGQNSIGYTLPSDGVTIALAAGQRLSVTIPVTARQSGEVWTRYTISAQLNNGLVGVLAAVEVPLTTPLPATVIFFRDEHLALRKSVASDANLPITSDLFPGMVRRIDSRNAVFTYDPNSVAPANNVSVLNASTGRWLLHPIGFSSHITSTTGAYGADQELGQITDTLTLPQLPYAGNGQPGIPQTYWIVNNSDLPIPSGTRIGCTMYVNGVDFSDSFVGLMQLELLGHVNPTTGQLDTSDSSGTGLMYGVGVVKPYDSAKTDLFLSKTLEIGHAAAVRLFPEYFSYQLPNIFPPNSLLTPYLFLYQNRTNYVEAGYLFGDVIYEELQRRRIVPTEELAVRALSGGGLIAGYSFRAAATELIYFLQQNTANQRILINVNGDCYVGVAESATERIRAVVSTQSGVSTPSAWTDSITSTNANPTFNLTLTYPTSIRSDYPNLGGLSIGPHDFAAAELVVYILNVTTSTMRSFVVGVTFQPNVPQAIALNWSAGTTEPSLDRPTASDELFGFYGADISNLNVAITSPGSGTEFRVSYAWKYNGTTVSKISHRTEDRCVQEMTGRLTDLLTRPSVSAFTDLLDTPNTLNGHATKALRVNASATGLEFAEPSNGVSYIECRAVATSAVPSRSGLRTIDGTALVAGDRVLLAAENPSSHNGIYIVSSGTWLRALDLQIASQFVVGKYVLITTGVFNANTMWFLTQPVTTVDTSPVIWRPVRGQNTFAAGLSFTSLTDTPSSYTGSAGRFLRVNSAGSGLEFVTAVNQIIAGAGISITPSDGIGAVTITATGNGGNEGGGGGNQEGTITGKYRQFVYVINNGALSFVTLSDGTPVMALQDLE